MISSLSWWAALSILHGIAAHTFVWTERQSETTFVILRGDGCPGTFAGVLFSVAMFESLKTWACAICTSVLKWGHREREGERERGKGQLFLFSALWRERHLAVHLICIIWESKPRGRQAVVFLLSGAHYYVVNKCYPDLTKSIEVGGISTNGLHSSPLELMA